MTADARVTRPTPAQDFAGYLRSFAEEMTIGDEDPEVILDRYYTADFVHTHDGIPLDREKLVAHAKPVRKNVVSYRLEIHETLVTEDRVAARYAIHSTMRKGAVLSMEVYLFGELAEDGRIRRIVSTSRRLEEGGGADA